MRKTDCENVPAMRRENETVKKPVMKIIGGAAAIFVLIAASVTAGYCTAPEDTRLPVLLADGEVIMQPCYVAVDGKCVALVKDESAAEDVVARVKDEYKNAATTQVEIKEKTSIGKLVLENGAEKPDILTPRQASEQIVNKQCLTVETTEIVEIEQKNEHETINKESDELQQGQIMVQQTGKDGLEKVCKKVVKENGMVIEERVLSSETLRESVPEIIISGTAGLAQPLDTMCLTSPFGYRWGRQHEGIDLGMPEGSPIYASGAGTVTWAGYTDGYGNLIKIDHGDGMETFYAHCSRLDVVEGQMVEAGHRIAAVGSTGNSTGPHLHFEVRIDGVACDPAQWVDVD